MAEKFCHCGHLAVHHNENSGLQVCRICACTNYREVAPLIHEDNDKNKKSSGTTDDPVNHPAHYTSHRSGIECIDIVEHMTLNLGNAVKYCWRAYLKGKAVQDLQKAIWYINREINKINRGEDKANG